MAVYKLYVQLGLFAIFFSALAWFAISQVFYSSTAIWNYLLGFLAAQCTCLSVLYIWFLAQCPSQHYNLLSFHVEILIKLVGKITFSWRYRLYTKAWKNPRHYQERRLQAIIKENGETIYGNRFNLSDIQSLDEFRRRHPLTTYDHYRPYVERMMSGEANVLTKKTPTSFCRTTGTTGKPKYFPYTDRWGYIQDISNDVKGFLLHNYPSIGLFQKMLLFYVHPLVTKTEHGAKLETIGTFPDVPDVFLGGLSTPGAGFKINTTYESNYIHLLFGLRESDIGVIAMNFLSFLDGVMNQLKKDWVDIVRDIETGSINSNLKLPDEIRSKLSAALGNGDPARAKQLRREFEKGFQGIFKRVWPHLTAISSADHAGIWSKLERNFAEGVNFVSDCYGSTEGFVALHLGPKYMATAEYVPLPTYYITEFIKLQDVDKDQPRTYFLDEVEVDESYEVVITQPLSGIYRYRQGDVVQITGFHENCPIIRFMFRLGQILNLHFEKLSQNVVEESLVAAVARWSGAGLVEYTVAESTLIPDHSTDYDNSDVPYYLMFLELEGTKHPAPTDEEKRMVDEELQLRNADYNRLRREGAISQPRIYLVRPGSFEALQDFSVSAGATAAQYKSPRKLRSFPMLELMMRRAAME